MVVTILVFLAFLIVGYYSSVDMLGLYLFLLIIHGIFVKFAGQDFQNAPAVIGVLVVLMVVSKKNLSYWRSRDIKLKYIILYVAIFLAMILTGFFGINYDNSMFYMHLYMKGFVLTLLVYLLVDSRPAIERIAYYYLLGVIVGAIWVGYEFATDTFSGGDQWTKRAAGLRADPNNTSMLMVAGIPLAYYFSTKAKRWHLRLVLLLTIPFIVWAMALTGSRGGMLSLLFVALLIIFNKPSIKKFVAAVIVAVAMVLASPGVLFERAGSFTTSQSASSDGSLQARLDLLKTGLHVFAQRPVMGVGPGNFGQAMMGYKLRGDVEAKVPAYLYGDELPVAHNMFLEVFAELGILGGLLFFGVLYFSLSNYWRGHRLASREGDSFSLAYALWVAMIGFLVAGLFLSQGKESVLWFLLGLGLAFPVVEHVKPAQPGLLVKDKLGTD